MVCLVARGPFPAGGIWSRCAASVAHLRAVAALGRVHWRRAATGGAVPARRAAVVGLVYRNFDIHLTPVERGYRVQVFNAPAGDAVGDFVPPIAGLELAELLASLAPGGAPGRNLRPNAPGAASTLAPVEVARTVGTQLFDPLFD